MVSRVYGNNTHWMAAGVHASKERPRSLRMCPDAINRALHRMAVNDPRLEREILRAKYLETVKLSPNDARKVVDVFALARKLSNRLGVTYGVLDVKAACMRVSRELFLRGYSLEC